MRKPRLRKKDRVKAKKAAEKLQKEQAKRPVLPEVESAGAEMLEYLHLTQERSENAAAGPSLREALR